MNMSQFLEGSFGRLESHDWGMPVYFRAAFMPDSWTFGAVGPAPFEDIGLATSRTSAAQFRHGSGFGGDFQPRDIRMFNAQPPHCGALSHATDPAHHVPLVAPS